MNLQPQRRQRGLEGLLGEPFPRRSVPSVLIGILFMIVNSDLRAAEKPSNLYDYRALYVYNFVRYTRWPAGHFSSENKFRIGVVGNDKARIDALHKMLGNLRLKRLDIVIELVDETEPAAKLTNYHVIFVVENDLSLAETVVERVKEGNVLTVMEIENQAFEKSGGIINFSTQSSSKLNFIVNQGAAKDAGLKFDPRLLKLARRILNEAPKTMSRLKNE